MECPYCKYENRDGVHYCSNCGKPLNPTATTAGSSVTASSTANPGTSRSLTVGSRLQGGRYVIKKVLGEGGMGAALLATDNRLDNKLVVIKELISENIDPAKRQADERNFKREVLTVAHLDHPLIPNVTDYFEEGSRYFMVQEYVEGENLEDRINRLNQPMRERDVLEYASEVLDVLDYLGQQTPPIVHRDIKPANIVISSKDKRAHLVDFGIAREDENLSVQRKQTSALGTPGYAPPEQYQGNADPRSDLYALGATMHHLLTNRDPRNHPPFIYPPARSLNPQLSPDVERLLTRALVNDINQRYQSAAAMKRDVDDILLKRFGVSGNISSYTLGTSGPMNAIGGGAAAGTAAAGAMAANASAIANQPARRQSPAQVSPAFGGGAMPPRSPYPVQQRQRSSLIRNAILLLIVILLIGGVIGYLTFFRGQPGGNTSVNGSGNAVVNGIGVTKASDNEYIGISDGTYAFDIKRPDGPNKQVAATRLKSGDANGAESAWEAALGQESNDPEVLIYLEDQQVLASGRPYITIVVGTMLTGGNVGVGRDDLQGAYVAQKEYNDGFKLPGSVQLRLLIANSGTNSADATTVAKQIVQAAQADKTIVGVMGWPFSSNTVKAIQVLNAAQIPMVSETASSDSLTGISKYFFRVAPANLGQGIAGAHYVEQTLHATKAALFVDPVDPYSSSLADDFSRQFTADGNTIVATEKYTVGKPQELPPLITEALNHNPEVIYFSGYAADIGTLLTDMPTSGPPVMGGDALYELQGYPSSARANFNHLHFTSFAYPDEWDVQGLTAQKPPFFTEYSFDFDPSGQKLGPYGFTRADGDVILSYDAMQAMLAASKIALAGGNTSFTPNQLRQALTQIKGSQAIQGVSGQIAFGPNGDPVNKAFVILHVSPEGFIQEEPIVQGTFLLPK